LLNSQLKSNQPTLVISECVLVYLNEVTVPKILDLMKSKFTNLTFIDYEMFNGNDYFGKMMVKNFKK